MKYNLDPPVVSVPEPVVVKGSAGSVGSARAAVISCLISGIPVPQVVRRSYRV